IPAVIGVSLSRTRRIAGSEIGWTLIFEFCLARESSIEPCHIVKVVVDAAAVLIRVIGSESAGGPVEPSADVGDGSRIEVHQCLTNRIDAVDGAGKIVSSDRITNKNGAPRIWSASRRHLPRTV